MGIVKEIPRSYDGFLRRNLLLLSSRSRRVADRTFLPPFTAGEITTFGPFYEDTYDALIVNFNKRFNRRFLLGANYTFAKHSGDTFDRFQTCDCPDHQR